MRFPPWIRERIPGVADNLAYDVLKGLLIVVVGWVVYMLGRMVLPFLASLNSTEEKQIAIFVALIAITSASMSWAIIASRRRRLEDAGSPKSNDEQIDPEPKIRMLIPDVPPTPAHLSLPPLPVPTKDPNIHIEIREVLLQSRRSGLFMDCGCNVLLKLHMVNRGSIEPTITDWNLDVSAGTERFAARVVPIPASLYIERQQSGAALLQSPTRMEEIPRPTLDETARDPFKRGVPKDGWIMFFMQTWATDYAAPYNAEFKVTAKDSMGVEHTATKGPGFHKMSGEIKFQSAGPV